MNDKGMRIYGRPAPVFLRALFILVFLCILGPVGLLTEKYNGFSPSLFGWVAIAVVALVLFSVFVIDCLDDRSLFSSGFLKSKKHVKVMYLICYLLICFAVSSEVVVFYFHRYISVTETVRAEAFLFGNNDKVFCERLVTFVYDDKDHYYCVSSADYDALWGYGFKYREKHPDTRLERDIEASRKSILLVARNYSKKEKEEAVIRFLYPPMMYVKNKVSVLGVSFSGVDLSRMPEPKPWPKPVPLIDSPNRSRET